MILVRSMMRCSALHVAARIIFDDQPANTDAVAPSLKNTDLQLNTGDTITSTITLDRAPHNTASCRILMDATLLYGPGEQVAFRQFPKFRGIVLYK